MSSKLAKGQEPISYQALLDENRALQNEVQSLKTRLEEAEELKRAISEGDLDALIINGPEGELIFTLDSADRAYRVLVETMNEGTVTLACDGIILYSNRQFANFLKISPQEVVGKPIYPFIAPESAATFKALLEHEAGMGEINLLAEGGTVLPVYLSISSLKNEGSPNAWCLVVTDLTEQKRSEEIIAAERLARSIIEQAAEAIIVCDMSGKIIRFSNATFRICGHDPIFKRFEDIVDLRFSEGMNTGESIHPVLSALKGSSVLGVEAIFEKNCYRMHLLLNSGPLKNADGKIIGCVVTLTDITERKQIEEALRESEERLRLLGDNLPDSVVYQYCHEPDGSVRFLYCSAGVEKLNCVSPADVLRDPGTLHRQILSDSFKQLVEAEERSARELLDFDMDIPMQRPDGQVRWMRIHSRPRKLPDGRVVWDGVQIDITEHKQAEMALLESQEKYRTLFENSIDAVLLTSPDGTIYAANSAACRIFGMTEEEIIRSGRNGILDTSDPRIQPALEERARTGKFRGELNYKRKDGTFFPGEVSSSLFTDRNGLVKTSMIIRDITERKKAEEALRESEEKYRNIIETANEGIWIVDPDAITTYVNQKMAQMLGCTQEEMIGKSARDFTDEEGRDISKHNMEKREQGTNESHEFKLIRKDGSPLWTLINAKSLFDKNGKFIGSISMLTDITGRKKVEAELQKTLEDLESLVKERTAELEKAYESLKESEAGLSEAQEMAHLGNWDRDLLTGELYWSDEVYRIFGYNPQEFRATYDSFLNYVHPDDRDYVKRSIEETLNGKPYDINYRILSTDGTERIVHSKGEITFDKEGIPVRMKGIIQDITGYKQMEAALERVARLSQENPDPVLRLSQGNIINYANTAARTLLTDWGSAFDQEVPEEIAELAVASLNDGFRRELECTYANHTYLINIAPFPDYVNLYAHNITERKKARQALEEMERIRIKEIHHRIKNNLQVISSLISLEAEKFSDTKILEAFKESQHRVASMALIHEELYKGSKADSLDFGAYLQKLTAELFTSYSVGNDNISLSMDLEQVYLDMDTAIPLGIIVNELISNSLKHAFSAGSKGEICVSLCRTENLATKHYLSTQNLDCAENNSLQYILMLMDNGKGIPEEIELESSNSLGLQLVNILVEQIDGRIELRRDSGTKFFILFGNSER